MDEEIGVVAGQVWSYLSEHEETSVSQLRSQLNKPERLVYMALGWLAREGKVTWNQQGRALYVSVNREEA